METDLVPRSGYDIKTVKITNLSRGHKPADFVHNLETLKNVATAITESKRIIRDYKPDVAVGTGGYVCYPVLKAASELHIPTAVHESNAVPGLTTKLLENSVDAIMVGFEGSRENYRRPNRVVVTGTPVRRDFLREDRDTAQRELGMDLDRLLVVSVWGSLGAEHMNAVMTDFIARACKEPFFDIVHSAGKSGYAGMVEKLSETAPGHREKGMDVREYIYDMPRLMAAADLVLCRAGASTLAELTAMGKPAILVPSPNVTNNHQERNARVLEEAGGAKVLLESQFDADTLYETVSELLRSPQQLKEMSECMRAQGATDATDRIAELILGLAEKK